MKKALIITYYWPPSGGAGVQRWVKFVKYLPNFGFEPIVLTVDPDCANYPVLDESLADEITADLQVFYTKTSEPFNLYKKATNTLTIPQAGFANESNVGLLQKITRFIRGNFFIPDARKGWNKFALKKARELIKKHEIKAVITTSPPHSSQLIGLSLKKDFNIKWIADLRDPWTDIYYYDQMYHTSLAKRADRSLEKQVLKQADHVITVSNTIESLFYSKIRSVERDKFIVIPNGFDEEDFKKTTPVEKGKFIIAYTGTLATTYNIESFLKAVLKLSEEIKSDKILVRFVGIVTEKYKRLIRNTNLSNITEFVDHVKHAESIKFLQQSSILFLAIPDVQHNEGILTGKLFEYLGSGKSILAIGPVNGDASNIIRECNAGEMFDYGDQDKIFDFLKQKYDQWESGKIYQDEIDKVSKYSRKKLTKKLADLINDNN